MSRPALTAAILSAWLFSGSASAQEDALAKLWWRVPATADVSWRGQLPTEGGAIGAGPQIGPYVVPGPAGLLVAIFTHGAIMQGVQSSQRTREQEEADTILQAYSPALKAWPARSLWEAAAGSRDLLWDGTAPSPGTVVDVLPVFSIAQDETALLLDTVVKIVSAGAPAPIETAVRVVSSPCPTNEARAMWSADDAKHLKDTAAAMLAHAVVVARQYTAGVGTAKPETALPVRTHRYRQGSADRAERAQRLDGDCSRMVLRTLRGGLLSVPVARVAGVDCDAKPAF